jgi:hypothetical protein
MMSASRFRLFSSLARLTLRILRSLGLGGTIIDPMRRWTEYRIATDVPPESFRELWRKRNVR